MRLQEIVREHDFEDANAVPQFPEPVRCAQVHRIMEVAYLMYGRLDGRGLCAVDVLRASRPALPAEESRALEALAPGWFSAFEVVRVQVDAGIELRTR